MDTEKKPEEAGAAAANGEGQQPGQSAPQDALERSNEDLQANQPAEGADATGAGGKPPKKLSPLKAFLRRFNVYLLLFLLIVVVAAVFTIVSYLNGKKAPKSPSVATQQLTQNDLKQLANSNATVGDSGQVLTVQGDAIFSGQVLIQKDLNVAGTIKLGNELSVPQLTVSGNTNLANTQINSIQVANGSTFQGTVTIQHDLNVGGTTSFNGPVTASQITVTKLIMSGNAQLSVPNHLAFTGSSPSRSVNSGPLGAGGSASVSGSDTAGTINVNSGNGPGTGCFITLTFNQKFSSSPHVVITPIGSAAGSTGYYVNRSTTSMSVCFNNPPPANQSFAFDYFVTD